LASASPRPPQKSKMLLPLPAVNGDCPWSKVAVFPLPRRVTLEWLPHTMALESLNVPGLSLTTWPCGHAAMALVIAGASFPPLGDSVAQIVVRVRQSLRAPARLQSIRRLAGIISAKADEVRVTRKRKIQRPRVRRPLFSRMVSVFIFPSL